MADEELQSAPAIAETPDDQIAPASEPFKLKPVPVPAPEAESNKAAPPKPEEAAQSPFNITVGKVYDGPLDLLLDLIRKQNIDIYDIPIALITAQFFDYCHLLKQSDVDAAG